MPTGILEFGPVEGRKRFPPRVSPPHPFRLNLFPETPMPEMPPAQTLCEGKHLRFRQVGGWEYIERTRADLAVVVAAITPGGRVLFVEQFRPPVGCRTIELPAGLVGDGDGEDRQDVIEAARRELLEETGYEADSLQAVSEGPISPGLSNERIVLIIATGLRKVADGGGVENEDITVHEVPFGEVESWIAAQARAGVPTDPKVFAGLYFLLEHTKGSGA